MTSEPIETGHDNRCVRPDGKGPFNESVAMTTDRSDGLRAKHPRFGAAGGGPRVRTAASSGAATCAS
jgi:hypothetical protein